jgi:hypothetical protein
MEAVNSSETSVKFYQTTWCYIAISSRPVLHSRSEPEISHDSFNKEKYLLSRKVREKNRLGRKEHVYRLKVLMNSEYLGSY